MAGPHVVPMLLAFEDERHLVVVLELCDGGDMRTHMRRAHYMKEPRIRDFIAIPVLRALAKLQHEVGIMLHACPIRDAHTLCYCCRLPDACTGGQVSRALLVMLQPQALLRYLVPS